MTEKIETETDKTARLVAAMKARRPGRRPPHESYQVWTFRHGVVVTGDGIPMEQAAALLTAGATHLGDDGHMVEADATDAIAHALDARVVMAMVRKGHTFELLTEISGLELLETGTWWKGTHTDHVVEIVETADGQAMRDLEGTIWELGDLASFHGYYEPTRPPAESRPATRSVTVDGVACYGTMAPDQNIHVVTYDADADEITELVLCQGFDTWAEAVAYIRAEATDDEILEATAV